jgi:hypothetical protein
MCEVREDCIGLGNLLPQDLFCIPQPDTDTERGNKVLQTSPKYSLVSQGFKIRLTTHPPRTPRHSAHMPLQLISHKNAMHTASHTCSHFDSSATSAVPQSLSLATFPGLVLDLDPPTVRCRSTTAKKATSGQTEMVASYWR